MHMTVLTPRVWQRWKEARHLSLLVTFEDSSTGSRVKEYRQNLSHHLGQECRIIEHVWLFNMFRLRELREIAAEEAAAADLVIISMHETPQLPADLKAWLELWLQQKGERRPLLLALLDPTKEGATRAVETDLRRAARAGGVEFLVESWTEAEAH